MKTVTIGQGGSRMARADREKQVLDTLRKRFVAYSTHGLAKAMGMSNSPHFRGILLDMLNAGKIEAYRSQKPNGMDVYYWYHPDRENIHGQQRIEGF